MSQIPMPPVPQGLREMLKDYPEYIHRLQSDLMRVITKPSKSTPPFEVAIWELEGTLETFIDEAREELKAAEASGDAEAIENAKIKKFTLGSARADMGDISDLQAFLQHWVQS
jgi:hypothetical protein